VIDVLTYKLMQAARSRNCGHAVVVGGVAANRRLRERVSQAGAEQGIAVHIPGLALCGDNAAMIAAAGYHYLQKGRRGKLDDDVYSRVPL
jgi:N6-L-threonylcarbamoyladenine synthase